MKLLDCTVQQVHVAVKYTKRARDAHVRSPRYNNYADHPDSRAQGSAAVAETSASRSQSQITIRSDSYRILDFGV